THFFQLGAKKAKLKNLAQFSGIWSCVNCALRSCEATEAWHFAGASLTVVGTNAIFLKTVRTADHA
ncbi:MAG: hypothetical protein M0Q37_09710, partial [Sphaerochaeta sp.]|nr:hypothetical protein [Sphaerochaeta sp.]